MARGGKREGAGRPKGSGKYRETTKLARVPQRLAQRLQELAGEPLVVVPVKAAVDALEQAEREVRQVQLHQPEIELEVLLRSLQTLRQTLDLPPQASLMRPTLVRKREIRCVA